MFLRKLVLTAAFMGVAVPAFAAQEWRIDPATSSLTWTAVVDRQSITGTFTHWDARIAFDPNSLGNSTIIVKVDLASVNARNTQVESALKGPDFFNTASTPIATFTSNNINKISGGYVASGNLNLAGVTKLMAVPFKANFNGDKATAYGQFWVSRSAFGIGKGRWNPVQGIADLTVGNPAFDSGNGITDRVQLNFTVNGNMVKNP